MNHRTNDQFTIIRIEQQKLEKTSDTPNEINEPWDNSSDELDFNEL